MFQRDLLLNATLLSLRQNYGIICAFGVGFLLMLLFATEFNTGSAFDSAVTLFKRRRTVEPVNVGRDEEKARPLPGREEQPSDGNDFGERDSDLPDVFTWHHLSYVVPISGGQERRLLDDVSGYVAPGKLTALMGESGAGKVGGHLAFIMINLQDGSRLPCSMSLPSEPMLVSFRETDSLMGNHSLQISRHRRMWILQC